MKALLKYIHSPDVSDLETFRPTQEDDFGLLLQLMVSPEGMDGEESFDIVLCTLKWLQNRSQQSDVIFGRHYLFVFEYRYQKIYNILKDHVENIEAETWDALALQIGRIGKWEFEDYQE